MDQLMAKVADSLNLISVQTDENQKVATLLALFRESIAALSKIERNLLDKVDENENAHAAENDPDLKHI